MNLNTYEEKTEGLPIWISRISTRKTSKGWRADVYPNCFGLINSPAVKRIYIREQVTREQACCLASHKSASVRLYSQGCWLVAKCKEKYGESSKDRWELFSSFMESMKRKYDGLDRPVYQSEDAQREIAAALKLPLLTAAHSFPVGLVPA